MLILHNIFGLAYFPFFPLTRFLWFLTIIIFQSESLCGAKGLYWYTKCVQKHVVNNYRFPSADK